MVNRRFVVAPDGSRRELEPQEQFSFQPGYRLVITEDKRKRGKCSACGAFGQVYRDT